MSRHFSHILILPFLALLPNVSFGQASPIVQGSAGQPFYFHHIPPHEYQAHPQNWAIAQDETGLIYVGNFDGVLTFDGSTWELVPTPSNTTARSLDFGFKDRVFVGLQGDFGYLQPDSVGRTEFRSLLRDLPREELGFWDVWATHATESHVYFQTNTRLFRWDGSEFDVWRSSTGYHTSFRVNDEIYIRERETGLLHVDGDSLTLVPGGETFAETQIFAIGSRADGTLQIATKEEGLFILGPQGPQRFRTEADAFIREHRLYHGTTLPGGYLALAMLDGGGLLVIDKDGRIVEHWTEQSGIPDGWINHVFRDAQGGLWLALNSQGLVRIDPLSKISRYDSRLGLDGVISDITRSGPTMYAASSTGLFALDVASGEAAVGRFERIEGILVATDIAKSGDSLLVAGHGGLFSVRNQRARTIIEGTYFSVEPSVDRDDRYYLGSKTGVSLLQLGENGVSIQDDIVYTGEETFGVVEDANGDLWLTTRSGRIFRAELGGASAEVHEYSYTGGNVVGQIILTRLDDKVVMLGKTGFFTTDSTTGHRNLRFLPYNSSKAHESRSDTLLAAVVGSDGNLWKAFPDRIEIVRDCDQGCVETAPEILTYPEWTRPARVHVDESGVAWISSGSMLVRYDPSIDAEKSYEAKFPALLRRVTSIDSNRLLYGGSGADRHAESHVIPALPFQNNALRFEFALPSYNDVSGNEFQYWLEGKDDGWSDWTRETSKNYTNLIEGTYQFHLRGRNAQGYVSPESVYTFKVLPPWYRSGWAYSAYLLALIGIGLFVRRHRRILAENKKAKEQAKELAREREVNERLHDLNKRLQQANETLRQADRLKDEFLANTSHELRTPLTGILGCASILRDEVDDGQREFVDMIDENGQRLLNTLDSLLDLARLRAGLMELDLQPIDVGEKAHHVVRPYLPLAAAKSVDVDVSIDGDVCGLFDDHCLECVLNHLVGNAVKFTEGGRVHVAVHGHEASVVLKVEDTGVGIEEQFMPFLFDEFKQESTGLTRTHEGNGLGLAVTARVVELMGGDIDVQSEKGVGSTFTVRLPLRRDGEAFGQGDGANGQADLHTKDAGLAAA